MSSLKAIVCISAFSTSISLSAQVNKPRVTEKKGSPNVIIILADDQGYGGVNCYPHKKKIITPNIDRLAAEGAMFRQGYTSGTMSAPTRAGLLTGKYQQSFGFYYLNDGHAGGIPLEQKTIAELLKQQGYKTGMVGKWHVGDFDRCHPNKRGFDYFFGFMNGLHDYFNPVVGHTWDGGPEGLAFIMENNEPVAQIKYLTYEFTDRAVDFIKENAGNPFFLYLSYNAIHSPLEAPVELIDKYADNMKHRTRDDVTRAMTAALDEGVGKVVSTLNKLGIRENTLIFYLSDNGGAPHSDVWILRGHKGSPFEGGIKVPFIMNWKGTIPPEQIINDPVISIDIAPTILGTLSVPHDFMHGVDLLPWVTDKPNTAPHDILFWSGELRHDKRINNEYKLEDNKFAIRKGKWKLVSDPSQVKHWDLYNLEVDPGEKNGLRNKYPEKVAELYKIYLDWIKTCPPAMYRTSKIKRPNGKTLIDQFQEKYIKIYGEPANLSPGGYIPKVVEDLSK